MESKDKCKLCEASLNIEGFLKKCTSDLCNVYWSKKLFSAKKKFFDIIEKNDKKKKIKL